MDNNNFLIFFGMAVAVMALAIYFVFDPSAEGSLFPRCVFLTLTGWKCPGCGSQRALHSLLHGDLLGVIRFNAALPVAVALVAAYLVAEWKRTTWPRYWAALNNRWAGMAILVAVVAWGVLRNVADV
ncbi:MAG: DUF2752 domain-containing protein [Muribaculaceae bacterium]|nr:DUF2752 domain-containing protein [Muribaculaceae bacterium]